MSRPPPESTKRRLDVEVRSDSSALTQRSDAGGPGSESRLPEDGLEELESETFFALLSTQGRSGEWEPADQVRAVAFWGHVGLDFRHALLPPGGIVEVDCTAIMGAIEIRVPRGAVVDIDGLPLLGSFHQKTRGRGVGERIRDWVRSEGEEDDPDAPPLFRIRGIALMGSVEVK